MKKKVGILALVLVLVVAALGIGIAKWSESLQIEGIVNTGEVDAGFTWQVSNDPTGWGLTDEAEFGLWPTWVDGQAIPEPTDWIGARYDKDVGSIDCVLEDPDVDGVNEIMQVIVTNGYPCYFGSIWFTIDNTGTIPVKIESIKLVEISENNNVIAVNVELTACVIYYIDTDAGTVSTSPDVNGADTDDFSIHLSTLAVGQQIDPVGGANAGPSAIPGDLGVHVEQGADENASYDFKIQIVVTQWNE